MSYGADPINSLAVPTVSKASLHAKGMLLTKLARKPGQTPLYHHYHFLQLVGSFGGFILGLLVLLPAAHESIVLCNLAKQVSSGAGTPVRHVR